MTSSYVNLMGHQHGQHFLVLDSNVTSFENTQYEKIVDPFVQANGACPCSNCLVLTEFTRLGKLNC